MYGFAEDYPENIYDTVSFFASPPPKKKKIATTLFKAY